MKKVAAVLALVIGLGLAPPAKAVPPVVTVGSLPVTATFMGGMAAFRCPANSGTGLTFTISLTFGDRRSAVLDYVYQSACGHLFRSPGHSETDAPGQLDGKRASLRSGKGSQLASEGSLDFWPNDASVFCTSGQMMLPVSIRGHLNRMGSKAFARRGRPTDASRCGQTMVQVTKDFPEGAGRD